MQNNFPSLKLLTGDVICKMGLGRKLSEHVLFINLRFGSSI